MFVGKIVALLVIAGLALVVSYGVVFSWLLRRYVWPRTALGRSTALAWLVSWSAAAGLFWPDLELGRLALLGTALIGAMLLAWLFRSEHRVPHPSGTE